MAITFDGVNKLAIMSAGTTTLDLSDLWSRWKDWVLAGHAGFAQAFNTVGGEIAAIPLYLFPINGWRVKLPEANATIHVVGGILATEDGSDPFVNPTGSYVVRVEREAPAIAIGYSTSGSTGPSADIIAAAVLAAVQATTIPVNVQKMNGADVIGDGSEGNSWRGAGVPP